MARRFKTTKGIGRGRKVYQHSRVKKLGRWGEIDRLKQKQNPTEADIAKIEAFERSRRRGPRYTLR